MSERTLNVSSRVPVPLRTVVVCSVEKFLACGRSQGGFANIRCPRCHVEHLLAFSCRTRNFCGSCHAKRSVLFTEKLMSEILAPVRQPISNS